ncbi:hypothetical protein QDX25_07465 [Auritidibacter ignavus]|uniref:hypothetical protein n=1 Tax=Auritidibacter ignavus TaxID=678932 RepID=UPI001E4680D2|nr:hypothetical protein [Auritidibacter ignavus]WGH80642.1 hypothetical protein QDX25_07465 [Auritidibacter ignavus]
MVDRIEERGGHVPDEFRNSDNVNPVGRFCGDELPMVGTFVDGADVGDEPFFIAD